MTFRPDGARADLTATLTKLARIYPLVDAGQYQADGRASGTTAKVQTSGHGDVSSHWRPAATAAVDELRNFGTYLGRLLRRSGAASDWTDDPVLALLIAARPRLARALVEYRDGDFDIGADVAREARDLLSQARSALRQDFLRRMVLPETCLGMVLIDGEDGEVIERECGARLQAVFRQSRAAIYCADHPGAHKIETGMWGALIGDLLARRS